MASEIKTEELKTTFADNVYQRFIEKTYNIEGFYNNNLIDEISFLLEAEELKIK